ncbi:MAG: alkaline phosphatase family protein [Haloferacaceae archaeon]
MTRTIACLDGFDPAYLDATDTPAWDDLAAEGVAGTCEGLVPSLTNVNNVGIVTGAFPDGNGITGNTFYDRERGERVYMEDPSFLRCETRLARAAGEGADVVALVCKEKLRRMVGQGDGVEAASAEEPPADLVDAVGEAPDIYSGEASAWLFDAAVHVAETRAPDVLYVSTTDVVPHKHAPGSDAAEEWVRALDSGLGRLREHGHVVATADHGMNEKTRRVDLAAVLDDAGVESEVVRLIRDRHTYHHRNLGGAAYVYADDADGARAAMADLPGVDEVLGAEAAADRFRLPLDRIGDLLVLGDPATAFGPIDGPETVDSVSLRSHGAHHERRVPYVASTGAEMEYNNDAFDAALD